ncbi:hypothetical protein QE152_g27412 [Popillia japonica]|uniref:Uncharacterized protein n=1 Tax=Popillia japonica TaxID=7064 RepID=A0AAW1JV04_POPJA
MASTNAESSIESISDLAIKIGKINRFEDVKGRYDASGDDIKIKSLSKSNEASDSAMLNSTSSATTNSERVQHKPTLLGYFNVEISNRYGILSDVEMRDLESDLGNSSQVNDTAATRPVETEQLEGEALKKTPKPPPICFVSRVKQNYREFRANFTGKLPFYTYTPRTARKFAYLIKGLHSDVEVSDVRDELIELDIPIKHVDKFNSTKNPIFMAVEQKHRRSVQSILASKPSRMQYKPAPPPVVNAWKDRKQYPPLLTSIANIEERGAAAA